MNSTPRGAVAALAATSVLLLSACGSDSALPTLSAATPASVPAASCAGLISQLNLANTTVTASSLVAAGGLTVSGISDMPEHCLVTGIVGSRVSSVDGRTYGPKFEMRLPTSWNGRFFYQANGGIDGSVVTAAGPNSGGAPTTNALKMGFAVMSSDAGHSIPFPAWGLDPQARLDYGYQAVAKLTPVAKDLIKAVYGKSPDRSYFGGCSNGGRHAMIAAARYAADYDGILAGAPGFHLPKAATAQLWKVQQYASIATSTVASGADTGRPDITSAVTAAEWSLLGARITQKCDGLDGASDGIVSDIKACQGAFNLETDVPTCTGSRDGTCLTAAQKTVLGRVFEGARNSRGEATYSNFYFDPGVSGSNYAFWHYTASTSLDPGATAFIFTSPPYASWGAFTSITGLQYALGFSMDTDYPKIFATDATFTESPWSFMTPPNETDLSRLRDRGGKLLVYHGAADPIFSAADTTRWYDALQTANSGQATAFARYFMVPGMNHCSGGPATDQFDMLGKLVAWVEGGSAPDSVTANARGAGANVVNAEVPAGWSASRSRPLCAYPKVARYKGSGDFESAANFSCQ